MHPFHPHHPRYNTAVSDLTKAGVNQAWATGSAELIAECTTCLGYGVSSMQVSLMGLSPIPGEKTIRLILGEMQ